MIRMYRYSEGESSFIMIDGRDVEIPRFRTPNAVHALCLINDAAGIVIMDYPADSDAADFRMEFYGADGTQHGLEPHDTEGSLEGMVRSAAMCAVAFADLLGIKPFHSKEYRFEAADGIHDAFIDSHLGECKMVRLDLDTDAGATLCEGEFE